VPDFVFNIAKGAVAEKLRDDPTKLGILLLKTVEADAAMQDRATVAAILANNTEANFTNYGRKTGITATLTIDNSGDQALCDIADQSWPAAGGVLNNNLAKLIVFYDEGGTDGTRIPLTAHQYVQTTDGSTLTAQINTSGFYKAV
jgi:hypothetical protein